jgi:hemolysin III
MNGFILREPISAGTHLAWLLLSVPATALLWGRSAGDRRKQFSLLVFGLSLAFCYAASTLFHAATLSGEALRRLNQLDHIGIYVLIAGSYTPLACCLLRGPWQWGILAAAWLLAAAGAARIMVWGLLPPLWSTLVYLAMGWGAILCYFEIARTRSHRVVHSLLTGGVLYSVGAVLNLLHWPELWPGVFRAHELFHLFVMAGSLAHFWFMLTVVVPAPPAPVTPPLVPGFASRLRPHFARWPSRRPVPAAGLSPSAVARDPEGW